LNQASNGGILHFAGLPNILSKKAKSYKKSPQLGKISKLRMKNLIFNYLLLF